MKKMKKKKNIMKSLLPLLKKNKNLGYWINYHEDEFEIYDMSNDEYSPIYNGSRNDFIDRLMAHFGIDENPL